ncbi:MAG: lytic transglycosylase domain-containing protein [Deltaproteobacteria bacterium]|jgi:soluble lytic murein transglycosylase-like protein|nr:lytic transglycosylase domain-containing protein [Deltaproteobacteria bacterium]
MKLPLITAAWVLGLVLLLPAWGQAQLLDFAPQEQAAVEPPPAGTPPAPPASQEPYWITNQKKTQKPANSPEKLSSRPYWAAEPPAGAGPVPPALPVPGPGSEAPAQTAALFAPPPPPPAPPKKPAPPKAKPQTERKSLPGVMIKEFSFYKFTDDQGVTYLTDAPVDPRYRRFTVQITISRGSAPYRRLNLDSLKPFILKAAKRYQVDPVLITSIIKAESAFDPKAVSWAGARGLMQLMPKTAKLMGVTDSFDPEQNIMGGTRYIRLMLNRFSGNLTLAVAAYNSGPERVAKNMAVPDISETRNYVRTVLSNLEIFQPLFDPEDLLSVQPPKPPQPPAADPVKRPVALK